MLGAQQLRRRRVAEPVPVPLEHAIIGQQTKDPVQRVDVHTTGGRQVSSWHRLVADCVGHPELGHHMQTPGSNLSVGQCPDDLVRLRLAHAALGL